MSSDLVVNVAMEAFDDCILDRPVHPLYLPIHPKMVWLRQAVLDTVGFADHIEAHRPGRDGVAVPRLPGELNAVASENGVNLIGHCFEQVLQELSGRLPVRLIDELGHGKLASEVNVNE